MTNLTRSAQYRPISTVRYGRGETPWYRRNAFLLGALAVVVIFGVLLPEPGSAARWTKVLLGAFALCTVAWAALFLSDVKKPEWSKTVVAFALLGLGLFLFWRYADAEWERLGHVFFNWQLMSEPLQGGYTGWTVLRDGLWLTVQLAVLSMFFSTLVGLLLAVFRSFNNPVLNLFIIMYIDFFRSMPIIVLMMLIYYALPFTGLRLSPLASGVLALTLNSAAYVSEIFRAGILSVKHGQIEASRALGLNAMQTMRMVILPQAFRVVLPPLASNYVASAKDTAICSTITLLELLKSAMQIQAFHANPTALVAATVIYVLLLVPLTRLAGVLETRMKSRRSTAR